MSSDKQLTLVVILVSAVVSTALVIQGLYLSLNVKAQPITNERVTR
ncbi:hypothetical protein H6G33_09685 [Calothrix sp. FACHB-1219]|nr:MULTISPECIES: hypothetical protein [unclassified Calothrix]MBD2201618.1 hypothetical protein [Calothrix sp. FACHB-168]MBD2217304.1 hypothetical protein [Calothrix sp. FACHB-1219]